MDTGPAAAGKLLIDIEIGDLGRLTENKFCLWKLVHLNSGIRPIGTYL